MPYVLYVWTDGSLVLDKVTGVSSSGSGFCAHQSVFSWSARRWGHVDHVRPVGDEGLSCKAFFSVPRPLQTVQRAELWGVILALQSSDVVHLGVDNLNVFRHIGSLLEGRGGFSLFELVNDCDLLLLIDRMVPITKVKGNAAESMVLDGRVLGNDAADEAADFGRRRVGHAVTDAGRNLSGVCGRWVVSCYPGSAKVLHRHFWGRG